MIGTARVIQGNALDLPLPDASVDLICTSPPYFGLRSYQDAGAHYDGQIGSEATIGEWLDAMLAATREIVRVLKPSGSIFVNLGDKYAGIANQRERRNTQSKFAGTGTIDDRPEHTPQNVSFSRIRDKSLMGMPWRYAIRCIDELGLILRAEIIWSKPNGLPESVTDRVRRSHEQWFHFTVQPRYFAAVDEIREPHTGPDIRHFGTITADAAENAAARRRDSGSGARGSIAQARPREYNPMGKLPGSVWTIPTQPLTVPPHLGIDHFAAFPMEWPRRIIQGWTPNGICTACGEGRRPVSIKDYLSTPAGYDSKGRWGLKGQPSDTPLPTRLGDGSQVTITGYTCGCVNTRTPTDGEGPKRESLSIPTAPTIPAVVLDPFGGTGTTALMAKALGRTGISVDLSHDYCRLAQWRTNDPRELAAALHVEKPEPIPLGQETLFGDLL